MYPPGEVTLSEILSQPEVWASTLEQLHTQERSFPKAILDYQQVIFTGCGSTYYLALWAARVLSSTYNKIAYAVPASDLWLNPSFWFSKDIKTLLVAISRSGETSETCNAVVTFHSKYTGDSLAITCRPDSHLKTLTTAAIVVPEAKEQSVVQTRSFTTMMLAVNSWLLSLPTDSILFSLKSSAQKLLNNYASVASEFGDDLNIQKFFFLGSGSLFGLACEAMLKFKEMTLSHSEAFHFLEIRHGPKSIVDQNSLVIGLLSENSQDFEISVLDEMGQLGAKTIAITDTNKNGLIQNYVDDMIIFSSSLPFHWQAPLYLPILQLMSYHRSKIKGLNPDRPLNLEAVVTLSQL